ncbi:hypothetical protein FKM82_015504 [Ascaphus truei]
MCIQMLRSMANERTLNSVMKEEDEHLILHRGRLLTPQMGWSFIQHSLIMEKKERP